MFARNLRIVILCMSLCFSVAAGSLFAQNTNVGGRASSKAKKNSEPAKTVKTHKGRKALLGKDRRAGKERLIAGRSLSKAAEALETSSEVTLEGRWGDGPCWDVNVQDSTAYFGRGAYLIAADVTNPSNPVELSRVLLPGAIQFLFVLGDYAYVSVGDKGLRIVDISNPAAAFEAGFFDTDGFAYGLFVMGDYAYVADMDGGLRIIDVSTPSAPFETGYYESYDYGWAMGVHVVGNYAYAAFDWDGLIILDVSDPADPFLVGSHYTEDYWAENVFVSGVYAYLANGWDGIEIINIADPMYPILVSEYVTEWWALDITIAGNYAYVADDDGLEIVDVSNPTMPEYVEYYYTDGWAVAVDVSGDYAYIADDYEGLLIVDVSDPALPNEAGHYDARGYAFDVAVSGDYAYVADVPKGLRILDISNLAEPAEAADYDIEDWAYGVQVIGDYAYIAYGDAGLQILDISDPLAPAFEGEYISDGFVKGVDVSGDYAYLAAGYYGLEIVNISNPSAPVLTGGFDTDGYTNGVFVSGNYAYLADGSNGLRIINVSDPLAPVEEGFYDTDGYALSVCVSGNYAYVADEWEGLSIIDISSPSAPIEARHYHIAGSVEAVTVSGNYAYLANGSYGLRIVDVSNPSIPTEVGFYDTGGYAQGVFVSGNYAYVADQADGLYIFNTELGPSGQIVNDGYGDYLLVPEGEFQMGDNFGEGGTEELPVHTVYLDAYYIGKYEVTNGEYKKFIDDGGYTTEAYWTAGGFGSYGTEPPYWNDATYKGGGIAGNENFPVVVFSWYEAMAYCSWLLEKTGKTYRLPTEAEWEKAARGDSTQNLSLGHQRRYPWGDNIDGSYANYLDSGDPYDNLTPVGFYNGSTNEGFSTNDNASPYGAYDMAGNVWEWCFDRYNSDYYQYCVDNNITNNPEGPLSGSYRVLRGGPLNYNNTSSLRSAHRCYSNPLGWPAPVGFRCVRAESAGFTISGHVYYSTTPLEDIQIVLTDNDDFGGPHIQSTYSDINGYYEFTNVLPDSYYVKAYSLTSEFVKAVGDIVVVEGESIVYDRYIPKIIQQLTPGNNEILFIKTPTLTWENLPETDHSSVYINLAYTWQEVESDSNITGTEYTVQTQLDQGVKYVWSVDQYDADNHWVGTTLPSFYFYVEKQPGPDWTVNSADFENTMSVTAQLVIDGAASADSTDIVAAFVDDSCRGVGEPAFFQGTGEYVINLTIYSNTTGETVRFKAFDASEGIYYDADTTITFEPDGILGTALAPVILNAVQGIDIEVLLNQGWTWFSINAADEDMSMNNVLSSLSSADNDLIKNQYGFSTFYEGFGWFGDLDSIYCKEMYMIKLASADTIRFRGMESELFDILLNQGWTWIGYLPQVPIAIDDALSSLTATQEDLIKNQTGFSTYYDGYGWFGDLNDLKPHDGYKIKMGSADTLTYPASGGAGKMAADQNTQPGESLISQTKWTVTPADYVNTMTMTAQLSIDGEIADNEEYIISVFAGEECRGVGKPRYFQPNDTYVVPLTIYSNEEEETLTFKAMNSAGEMISIKGACVSCAFQSDNNVGNALSPYILEGSAAGLNEDMGIPKTYSLYNNYPNPFNPETFIKFQLPQPAFIKLNIYNVAGQLIKSLLNENFPSGIHSVTWDGTNSSGQQVSSGVYLYKIEAGSFTAIKKMMFLK